MTRDEADKMYDFCEQIISNVKAIERRCGNRLNSIDMLVDFSTVVYEHM